MGGVDLVFERSFYIGGQFTGILYGINLVIFFLSWHFLSSPSYAAKRDSKFYICYGSALLALWTIALACNAVFGQWAWIDHRDVPGGPTVYIEEHISDWVNTLGTTAGIAMNFLSDALLIYRCHVIWASSWKIIAFPVLLFLGALSMSILLIYESAQPGANFFKGNAVDFGVPYVALTISINIIVTCLICGRLIAVRNQMRSMLGSAHAKMYTSVVSIMVESAAPFTILGILYAVTYARHSSTSIAFVQVWGDFCALSPQLIILRVAMGRAWAKDTSTHLSTTHMTFGETTCDEEKGPASFTASSPTEETVSTLLPSVCKNSRLV